MLTLQFGGYANYVATHYWNIQEAEFKEVLKTTSRSDEKTQSFSEIFARCPLWQRRTRGRNETYSPRTLIFDARGALGSLSAITGQPISRQAVASILRTAESEQIEIFDRSASSSSTSPSSASSSSASSQGIPTDLEWQSVRSWTDFCTFELEGRNIHELKEVQHEISTFDKFAFGSEVMEKQEDREDILDAIRKLVEECDSLLGFQTFVETDTGFGGFAAEVNEELRDQYGSRPIIVHAVARPSARDLGQSGISQRVKQTRLLNIAACTSALCETASLFVPMSCPSADLLDQQRLKRGVPAIYPGLQTTSDYQSSAPLALAADLFGLPCRWSPDQASPALSPHELVSRLRPLKITGLAFASFLPVERARPELISLWPEWTFDVRTPAYSQLTVHRREAPFAGDEPSSLVEYARRPLNLHHTFPFSVFSAPSTAGDDIQSEDEQEPSIPRQLGGSVTAVANKDVCKAIQSVASHLRNGSGSFVTEVQNADELYNSLLLMTECE